MAGDTALPMRQHHKRNSRQLARAHRNVHASEAPPTVMLPDNADELGMKSALSPKGLQACETELTAEVKGTIVSELR